VTTQVIGYRDAVLEIREAVANNEDYIISGTPNDIATVLALLGERSCVVWVNGDFGDNGVFKLDSNDVDESMASFSSFIAMVSGLLGVDLGIVMSVPKVGGPLPEELPLKPGKDLLCLNSHLPVMAAEAMRTDWPDSTVLPPEKTHEAF